jgi:hypothetical protein
VRKLLSYNSLDNPVNIKLIPTISNKDDARFVFDNTLSPILNYLNKRQMIDKFSFTDIISLSIDEGSLEKLKNKIPKEFRLEIV